MEKLASLWRFLVGSDEKEENERTGEPRRHLRVEREEVVLTPNAPHYTPLDKLRRQLELMTAKDGEHDGDDHKEEEEEEEERVVLVATGSFSPVHKMHVRIFEIARSYLLQKGVKVVGGFISPSHDVHVQAKLGDYATGAEDRLRMCELAVADSDWIAVSSWECSQPRFVCFDEVTKNIEAYLNEQLSQHRWKCYFLCGADLVLRCRLFLGAEGFGVVGVGRPEFMNRLRERIQEINEHNARFEEEHQVKFNRYGNFYMIEDAEEIEDCSSTLIRARIEAEQSVDDLTFPAVAEYLRTMRKARGSQAT